MHHNGWHLIVVRNKLAVLFAEEIISLRHLLGKGMHRLHVCSPGHVCKLTSGQQHVFMNFHHQKDMERLAHALKRNVTRYVQFAFASYTAENISTTHQLHAAISHFPGKQVMLLLSVCVAQRVFALKNTMAIICVKILWTWIWQALMQTRHMLWNCSMVCSLFVVLLGVNCVAGAIFVARGQPKEPWPDRRTGWVVGKGTPSPPPLITFYVFAEPCDQTNNHPPGWI